MTILDYRIASISIAGSDSSPNCPSPNRYPTRPKTQNISPLSSWQSWPVFVLVHGLSGTWLGLQLRQLGALLRPKKVLGIRKLNPSQPSSNSSSNITGFWLLEKQQILFALRRSFETWKYQSQYIHSLEEQNSTPNVRRTRFRCCCRMVETSRDYHLCW